MSNQQTVTAPPRSSFVTVLAWTFIVLAGFSVLIAGMQNVVLAFVLPMQDMDDMVGMLSQEQNMPAAVIFFVRHIQAIMLFFLVMSIATLIASIALLKRRNWARLVFIWMLAISIAGNLAWPFFQYTMMSDMLPFLGDLEHEFGAQIQMARYAMFAFSCALMLAFSWFSAWLIKRLAAPEIRAEFNA